MPPETTPVAPTIHHHLRQLIFALIAAIIVVGVVSVLYVYVPLGNRMAAVQRVSVYEDGALAWYSIQGDMATKVKGPLEASGIPTVRFSATPLASGETPIITDSDKGSATILALLAQDKKSMHQILNDESPKYELAARPDGRVVFAEYQEIKKNGITSGDWNLISLSSKQSGGTPIDLGPGFSSAFTSDGALLAITPNGLTRINPDRGGYTTIIARRLVYGSAAIAPDARLVVLPNEVTHAFDVFAIAPAPAAASSYVGSITAPGDAVSFISPTAFLIKDNQSLTRYDVHDGKITLGATATIK